MEPKLNISEELARLILVASDDSNVLPTSVEECITECRKEFSHDLSAFFSDIAHRIAYRKAQGETDPSEAILTLGGGLKPEFIAEINDRLGISEERAREIMRALHGELLASLPTEGIEFACRQKLVLVSGELIIKSL